MLHLRCLGTFHITFADGREPAIETSKGKALLAYLATESDRPHLREQLATIFWPEADQKAALQSLRQALYALRRQLQPAGSASTASTYLAVTRQDVAFNFDSEHWIDVEAFATLIRSTQHHAHRQVDMCPECVVQLEEAVELYRGEFLSGLTLADADGFEEWRLARQEWFRVHLTRALVALVNFHERRRDFASAQRYLLRLLELEPWDEEAHRRLIRLYALDNQRGAALQQYEVLRRLLAQHVGAEPGTETDELIQEIQHGALAEPVSVGAPYKGLYPFSLVDSGDFFGREETARYLLNRLHTEPVVVVIGPSGSGKSSLVHARVIPSLLSLVEPPRSNPNHRVQATGRWAIVEFRPGADPVRALAEAIASLPKATAKPTELMRLLSGEDASLHQPGILPRRVNTLIYIDQFEEIYTLCSAPTVRRAFIDLLLNSARSTSQSSQAGVAPVRLLISMRADFTSQALTHLPLADAMQRGGVVLGPMPREDLRRAIEEPARNRGVTFEPGLVERLLDDVGEAPGNLPLLQFALAEVWERRVGFQITHDAYDDIGRVSGALASYADRVYQQLSDAEQIVARRLFIQLVQPGDETGDTRRPALRTEVSDEAWVLARKLADLRLVVTGHGDRGDSVELVHETLIRSWVQLSDWMDEDRDFRRWQQRLRTYTQQWLASNREEDALLRGVLLAEAERWVGARRSDLSAHEQAYIDASVAARNTKLVEIEAAHTDELLRAQQLASSEAQRAEAEHQRAEIERTARRRLRWLVGGLAGVLVAAVLAAGVALGLQQQANVFARQALARQLAAQAINLANDVTDLSLLLAEEAMARMSEPEDITNLLVSYPVSAMLTRYFRGGGGDLTQLAMTPDGTYLWTVAENGQTTDVDLWGTARGQLDREVLPPQARTAVALSHDGAYIATATETEVQLWDGSNGAPVATWEIGAGKRINALQFTRDDRRLLVKEEGQQTISIWDTATRELVQQFALPDGREVVWLGPDDEIMAVTQDVGAERGVDLWAMDTMTKTGIRLGGHESSISDVAFSPDGAKIATASFDNTVRVWDARRGELLFAPFAQHDGRVLSVTFSPDGRILATGGADRRILLYDIISGKQIGEPLIGHDNWVRVLRFDPTGAVLYSGGTGGTLIQWEIARRTLFDGHTDRARSVAISPDGAILASAGFDYRVLLWDANSGDLIRELPSPHERAIIQTAYSSDGRYLATGDAGGFVTIWDVAQQRVLHSMLRHQDSVIIGMTFSPDSRFLATGDFDGHIAIWDVMSGDLMRVAEQAHDGWTLSMTFTPDGQTLTTGGTDNLIRHWDTSTLGDGVGGTLLPRGEPLVEHTYWVTSLLYTADGTTLISGSADNTVRFWDAATGAANGAPLTGQKAQIWGVAFYPPTDEQTLVTLANNGTVMLWDIASRTPLAPALRTGLETEAFAVSPDGRAVYLGSFDARIERWRLDELPWRDRGCGMAARTLSTEEWEHYLRNTAYRPACAAP